MAGLQGHFLPALNVLKDDVVNFVHPWSFLNILLQHFKCVTCLFIVIIGLNVIKT
jgi:hypothetical protein